MGIKCLISDSKRTNITLDSLKFSIGDNAISKMREGNYNYHIEGDTIYLRKDKDISNSDNPEEHDIKISFHEHQVETMSLIAVLYMGQDFSTFYSMNLNRKPLHPNDYEIKAYDSINTWEKTNNPTRSKSCDLCYNIEDYIF